MKDANDIKIIKLLLSSRPMSYPELVLESGLPSGRVADAVNELRSKKVIYIHSWDTKSGAVFKLGKLMDKERKVKDNAEPTHTGPDVAASWFKPKKRLVVARKSSIVHNDPEADADDESAMKDSCMRAYSQHLRKTDD